MAEAQESTLRQDLNHPESRKRALYAAFASKDARFDGQAFVGVSSTGVYCRPVCHVHMPKYENCTFYETAAEAEAAGYRPCLVCRPELAPGHSIADASANLARRAASLLREGCTSGESLERMAERLGYTDRHLRRAFQREFEVTPVQYLQTCRLLLAKSLLTDSDLPVSQVAAAAGFKSVRRFNDLFKERSRLTPTAVRKSARRRTPSHEGIASLDDAVPGAAGLGTRGPGCFDPFETAVRAVLGQQVTVVAANRLAARIVERYGKPMDTGIPGLTHAFPTAAEVAALEPIEDALGVLGVIKTRSRTIAEIARLLEAGDLRFDAGAVVAEQMERLLAVKGIGPWSANYLAMRVLNHPDAFMETDAGVKHALPHLEPKERLELAEQWRPWRSYAVLCLWNSLAE